LEEAPKSDGSDETSIFSSIRKENKKTNIEENPKRTIVTKFRH